MVFVNTKTVFVEMAEHVERFFLGLVKLDGQSKPIDCLEIHFL